MITEDVAKLVVQIENSSKNGELQNELTKLQQKTGIKTETLLAYF